MSDTNSFRSQELTTDPPRASGDATAKPLDTFGHALSERLGVGGMGEVYRCGDEALQRDLAIKILKDELRGNADAEERFLREARLTGSLQHPGIVPIHHLSRLADGRPCYTMKLVRGRTFADMLRDEPQGPERLPRLLAILEKVCQAVAYAHSKHVIHRDLKPSNVMVGEFGEVQVMDWGLAKELRLTDLFIQQQLTHWRRDPDFVSVRDPQALDRLPDGERAAWQALWRDVDELAKRAAKPAKEGERNNQRDDSKSSKKGSPM